MMDADGTRNYLEQLEDFFRFLLCNEYVASHAGNIASTCGGLTSDVARAKKYQYRDNRIEINPNFRVPISRPDSVCSVGGCAELFVGGEILLRYGEIARQVIVITITYRPDNDVPASNSRGIPEMTAGRNYVARRFHYDFDKALCEKDRPNHHLQMGGKFSSTFLQNSDYYNDGFDYQLLQEMDEPRLPVPPTDITSVMDIFLHQFDTPIREVIEEKRWIEIVSRSEKLWQASYIENVLKEIKLSSRSNTIYRHLCRS